MNRTYELMFIVRPDMPEEDQDKLISTLESVVTTSGGTVKNGTTWTPGSTTGTGLALVTNNQTSTHFTLKELPISAAGPGPAIPVPTAAWTGLTTMLGLGLISAGKKAYHRLF